MDCLDEPLHLQILTALAANYADNSTESQPSSSKIASDNDGPLRHIYNDLPDYYPGDQTWLNEDAEWDEFDVDYALSSVCFMQSAPQATEVSSTGSQTSQGLLERIQREAGRYYPDLDVSALSSLIRNKPSDGLSSSDLGELQGSVHGPGRELHHSKHDSQASFFFDETLLVKSQMGRAVDGLRAKSEQTSAAEWKSLLPRAVSVLAASPEMDNDLLHYLVELPLTAFTPIAITSGIEAWTFLLRQRPAAKASILSQIALQWSKTMKAKQGLFCTSMDYQDPFVEPIEYSPSNQAVVNIDIARVRRTFQPHLSLIQFLSTQVDAIKDSEPGVMMTLGTLVTRSIASPMSTHSLAREVRFALLLLGFRILATGQYDVSLEPLLRDRLFSCAFSWFSVRPQWTFGSDDIQVGAEIRLLRDFSTAVNADRIQGDQMVFPLGDGAASLQEYTRHHRQRVTLLALLVENEVMRLAVWSDPCANLARTGYHSRKLEKSLAAEEWTTLLNLAWRLNSAMAVHMGERFHQDVVKTAITKLVRSDTKQFVHVPEALRYVLGDQLEPAARAALKWLPIWAAVPPVTALAYFQPQYKNHPLVLQYGMRVLEQHPVGLTFFFVPQVVQALRTDKLGYVEQFIFETSKISQLFCHQIIWNMKANTCRGDDGTEEDPMKPLLDRMIDMVVAGLSPKAKAFYDLEFSFFDEVTSISGKLKPFIKKTKPEKKEKIDQEMAKIKVSVGVYLPSNPDGSVVDIVRDSGRPLQSHAKAPFMATFKVQKERLEVVSDPMVEEGEEEKMEKRMFVVSQSAIFKVGDDCRQDVLALQLIAMFKNIFTRVGLPLYLFPYRVTATAPGCGVIDVVPNSISRDEIGRTKINDLVGYFADIYGGTDSVAFQKARLNFIQSMAAYSVACYILQIKDRHNGNIMIDGDGHIIHIDFGFLFDIGPGGIKFEPNSFKLNYEMVALMGGRDSEGYSMFCELAVKAFLAIRPYADQLIDTTHLMLGTGFPSFQGEPTIKRLRQRFQLQLGERAAAEYMMGVIRNAHQNMRSNVYDGFQKLQNGIPY